MDRSEPTAGADTEIRAAAQRIKSELTANGSRPDRPARVKFYNLPPAMTAAPRWVLWAWARVNEKWTKRPLTRTGAAASTTNPDTWCAFAEARAAYEAGDQFDGIGFVLGGGWAGVDIDKCAAKLAPGEPVRFTALAAQVALALSSYAEISPTGTGVKVFVRADVLGRIHELNKKSGYKRTDLDLELYAADRFFTVTGEQCDPAEQDAAGEDVPADRTAELLAVIDQFPPPLPKKRAATGAPVAVGPVEGEDADLLDRARRSKQGAQFAALYDRGDTSKYGGDDSAADLALCNMLAFWLGRDPARIERAFSASALGKRAKWRERADYRGATIGCAIEGATEVYDPHRQSARIEMRAANAGCTEAGGAPEPAEVPVPEWWALPINSETWNDPHRLARLFVDANRTAGGLPTVVQWRDEFFRWSGSAYRPVGDGDLDAQLARHARAVFVADLIARRAEAAQGDSTKPVKLFPVTGRVRSDTRVNLAALANVPDVGVDAPFWLRAAIAADPREVVAAPNGVFTLEQIARGEGPLALPTPNLFTLNALPFDVPRGECDPPRVWLEKVHEWFSGDAASILGLQEWMGYLLSADASQHKILMLVGPPRSGKGTVLRTIMQLVGAASVAATSFAAMGESFGLQDLIGKRVAMIPDARLSGRTDTAQVVERLLSVSGDDLQTVNRKNLSRVSTRLSARFVLGTNEIPKLADASGALASRFHILDFPNTYLDREDKRLGEKIESELPAILQWAAKGYVRLRTQGAFTQSEAAAKHHRHLEELSSPIRAFVRERCNIGPTERIRFAELYSAWCDFCESRALMPGADNVFGRDLRSACPHVNDAKIRTAEGRTKYLIGINLRARDDWGDGAKIASEGQIA